MSLDKIISKGVCPTVSLDKRTSKGPCLTMSLDKIISKGVCPTVSFDKRTSKGPCLTMSLDRIISNRVCLTNSLDKIISKGACLTMSLDKIISNIDCMNMKLDKSTCITQGECRTMWLDKIILMENEWSWHYILRDFRNAPFYIHCLLRMVNLRVFSLSFFILLHNGQWFAMISICSCCSFWRNTDISVFHQLSSDKCKFDSMWKHTLWDGSQMS